MPWARASALHRHLACSAASWLARYERESWRPGYLLAAGGVPSLDVPRESTVAADWGTQMHLAKEGHDAASDPWLSIVAPHRERVWPSSLGRHEFTWSYDCRTGLVTVWDGDGDSEVWKASRDPSCVVGTTDWHAALPSGEPWVDDLKTGWKCPPADSPQLLMYALVAKRLTPGTRTVRASVTHWPRGAEKPTRTWKQLSVALEIFEQDLHDAFVRATKTREPTPGVHCRWCPSTWICPAIVGEKK